jgi:hypothetical protein
MGLKTKMVSHSIISMVDDNGTFWYINACFQYQTQRHLQGCNKVTKAQNSVFPFHHLQVENVEKSENCEISQSLN